jgi:hypothetical protein
MRRSPFANPFFLLLTLVSTAFVMTALAYLVGPMVVAKSADDPGLIAENAATPGLLAWLDRHAPTLLAGQIIAMAVLCVLSMLTDGRFATTWRGARLRKQRP